LDKVRRHEKMVGSVSDIIPNYKEHSRALGSQLGTASKAYTIIMMTNDVAAKDDEIERRKIQLDDASQQLENEHTSQARDELEVHGGDGDELEPKR
jgi:hypothetical protein